MNLVPFGFLLVYAMHPLITTRIHWSYSLLVLSALSACTGEGSAPVKHQVLTPGEVLSDQAKFGKKQLLIEGCLVAVSHGILISPCPADSNTIPLTYTAEIGEKGQREIYIEAAKYGLRPHTGLPAVVCGTFHDPHDDFGPGWIDVEYVSFSGRQFGKKQCGAP